MANSKQAQKRDRQSKVRRERNMSYRSALRTELKKFLKHISDKKTDFLQAQYASCVKKLDQAVGKGLIHKNKAARLKSRFCVKLKDSQA